MQFILFAGCYALLNYGYFKIPVDLVVNVIYYHGVVTICADIINMIAPMEQVLAQHNHLLSAKADLEIVRGCDGAGVLFRRIIFDGVRHCCFFVNLASKTDRPDAGHRFDL